jgi:hypothetical protein
MQLYTLTKITPLSQLQSKDWKNINIASSAALKSNFDPSKRLGACIEGKGQCVLCG